MYFMITASALTDNQWQIVLKCFARAHVLLIHNWDKLQVSEFMLRGTHKPFKCGFQTL